MIWQKSVIDIDFPMSNAGGVDEFLMVLAWIDKEKGMEKDLSIVDFNYIKRAYSIGYKNVYTFSICVHRSLKDTNERYIVFEENGQFKLLRIFIDE